MKLHEIVDGGRYTVFKRMGAKSRARYVDTLKYIEFLASNTNTDINSWNIFEVFGTGKGKSLYIDKRRINQIFLETARNSDVGSSSAEAEFANIRAQINDACRQAMLENVRTQELHMQRILQRANSSYNSFMELVREASRLRDSLGSNPANNIDQQLQTIVQSGFWKFKRVINGTVLEFHTANNVISSYRNRSARIDIDVNLGKFKVTVDIVNRVIHVGQLANNVHSDWYGNMGFYHPHINRNGNVCWGNSGGTVTNMFVNADYAGLMQLLATILVDFNPDNPYVQLGQMHVSSVSAKALVAHREGARRPTIQRMFETAGLSDSDVDNFYDTVIYHEGDR